MTGRQEYRGFLLMRNTPSLFPVVSPHHSLLNDRDDLAFEAPVLILLVFLARDRGRSVSKDESSLWKYYTPHQRTSLTLFVRCFRSRSAHVARRSWF